MLRYFDFGTGLVHARFISPRRLDCGDGGRFGAFNLIATELIGPKVAGVKMSSYESGMDPIGTARQRFHAFLCSCLDLLAL